MRNRIIDNIMKQELGHSTWQMPPNKCKVKMVYLLKKNISERTDKLTDKRTNERTDGRSDFIMPPILFGGIIIMPPILFGGIIKVQVIKFLESIFPI